jgi:hypothetical protein
MGHSMTFQYIYMMCNDQIGVTAYLSPQDIYHFFVLETFKTLTITYFEIFN